MSVIDTESLKSLRNTYAERHHRPHHSFANRSINHSLQKGSLPEDRHIAKENDSSYRSNINSISNQRNVYSKGSQGMNNDNEHIEVQILPQDDNWGDNTTAITGNTSETAFSLEDITKFNKQLEKSIGFNCARYAGSVLAALLAVLAFVSPIVMVLLPKVAGREWKQDTCGPECEGALISLAFKLLILLIGSWALFLRRPKATMPRIFIFRALVLFLMFVLTFAFWLFYGVRIWETKEPSFKNIVLFSSSLVDGLLFIHYLAVVLLEVRQLQTQYVARVVRSPDGEAHSFPCGQLSIQRLATTILERYYAHFSVYNPYLEHAPSRSAAKMNHFKVYDVDGPQQQQLDAQHRAMFVAAAARHRDHPGHNDRFYEEQDYERRVRKRGTRLQVAAEEAFTHIKRMQQDKHAGACSMDAREAAQAVFPSMARALQKYLRVTRQQPRYTMENILQHLATCISYDLSPKTFLERYLHQGQVIWNDSDHAATQTWALVCDQLLSRAVDDGSQFQLHQGEISLLVQVRKMPHFNLTEEILDPKSNKFVLRLNSETSV